MQFLSTRNMTLKTNKVNSGRLQNDHLMKRNPFIKKNNYRNSQSSAMHRSQCSKWELNGLFERPAVQSFRPFLLNLMLNLKP